MIIGGKNAERRAKMLEMSTSHAYFVVIKAECVEIQMLRTVGRRCCRLP